MTNRADVSEVSRHQALITTLDAALRSSTPGESLRDIRDQYPQESASIKDTLSAVRNSQPYPPPLKTSVVALRAVMFS